jgi:hypothetical protein
MLKSLAQRRSELLPLAFLIGACLIIGLITVGDYGASWDEVLFHHYGDYAIDAYRFFLHPDQLPSFDVYLDLYGPAYFMLAALLTRLLGAIGIAWSGPTAWHLTYFVTFLACVVLLYLFSRRWFRPAASLGACLLFVSQPLFWGHAFINPKDLPFMAFFLASVYVGLAMVDHLNSSPRVNPLLIAGAAVLLGLTVSFRSAGPLAGAIVAIYAVFRSSRRLILLLLPYLLLSAAVTYLTWPFLWGAPLPHFVQSLELMSKFPFPTKVLFMGRFYAAGELPWFYYPVLLGIQFTEPMILLALVGLGLAVQRWVRQRSPGPLLLFIGWFLLPVVVMIVSGSTLYDNARQLMFLLPPVFLLVGQSLDRLIDLLRSRPLIYGVVLLSMLPGIYASTRLHPYEYVYYNEFVGGTAGASGKYELDYWGTSYRAAAGWLNQHAQAGSTIWVTGPGHLLELYLRPDLNVSCTSDIDCGGHHDYVVTLVRWKAERSCRGAQTVFSVARRDAVFSIIKQLAPGQECK